MKRLAWFLLANLLLSSKLMAAPQAKDYIVVKINNKAITKSEVDDRFKLIALTSKITPKSESEKKIILSQIIDKMVDEELIRQEAKNLKIETSQKEVDEAVEIVAANQKQTAQKIKALISKNNLSYQGYLMQIESELLWSKIVSEVLRGKVKVSEVETNEFFEQAKYNTDVRRFLLSEIMIMKSDNSDKFASKLVHELRSGADFNSISQQFSSSLINEIGWVSQSDIDPKIFSAISNLSRGGYSEPVLLGDGHHIFKVIDSKIESKVSERDLSAAKNLIFNRKLQNIAKGYLMDLRKKAFIEIKKD